MWTFECEFSFIDNLTNRRRADADKVAPKPTAALSGPQLPPTQLLPNNVRPPTVSPKPQEVIKSNNHTTPATPNKLPTDVNNFVPDDNDHEGFLSSPTTLEPVNNKQSSMARAKVDSDEEYVVL